MASNMILRSGAIALAASLALGCQPSSTPAQETESTAPTPAAENPAQKSQADPRAERDDAMQGREAGSPERDTTLVDASIRKVTLSNEGDTEKNTLGMPVTRFGPRDSVYAEIQSEGSAQEYTIYAKWTGADGNALADYGIKINEAGPKRTVISLSKPDGWPSGQNKIELAINGKALQTVTFDAK